MNDLLGSSNDVELQRQEIGEGDEFGSAEDPRMRDFFAQVDEVKGDINRIKGKISQLEETNEETKLVTRAQGMKDVKKRMDKHMSDIRKLALSVKNQLGALDKANLESRRQPGCGEGSSTDRTRMSVTAALKKKLNEITEEFQDLNAKMGEDYRKSVERRVYAVTGNRPSEETVDHLIETGESESIFQKAIQDQGRGKLMDTMAEISERHAAVKDIEKQLLELHELFMDMAVMVEAQQEYVDQIETHVEETATDVTQGHKELKAAKTIQTNTRKLIFWSILIGVIIVVVVIVIVVKPWQK